MILKRFLLAVSLSCLLLSGCKKLISTTNYTVQVKIVDKYHRAKYITPVFNGKTTTMIAHPAVYQITVEYKDVDYDISGYDTYNEYSNRIGEYVTGILEIKEYDDGSETHKIISLE